MARRTMYMHTLDGKPATIQRDPRLGVWLFFVGGRSKVRLRASPGEIRRDWGECLDTYERDHAPCAREAINAELERYGYVLVEVPV